MDPNGKVDVVGDSRAITREVVATVILPLDTATTVAERIKRFVTAVEEAGPEEGGEE